MIDKKAIKELFNKIINIEKELWEKGHGPCPTFYLVQPMGKDGKLGLMDVSAVVEHKTRHVERGRPLVDAWYRELAGISAMAKPLAVVMQTVGWRHSPDEDKTMDETMESYNNKPIRDRDDKIPVLNAQLVAYNKNGFHVYSIMSATDIIYDADDKFEAFGEEFTYETSNEESEGVQSISTLAEVCQWGGGR